MSQPQPFSKNTKWAIGISLAALVYFSLKTILPVHPVDATTMQSEFRTEKKPSATISKNSSKKIEQSSAKASADHSPNPSPSVSPTALPSSDPDHNVLLE